MAAAIPRQSSGGSKLLAIRSTEALDSNPWVWEMKFKKIGKKLSLSHESKRLRQEDLINLIELTEQYYQAKKDQKITERKKKAVKNDLQSLNNLKTILNAEKYPDYLGEMTMALLSVAKLYQKLVAYKGLAYTYEKQALDNIEKLGEAQALAQIIEALSSDLHKETKEAVVESLITHIPDKFLKICTHAAFNTRVASLLFSVLAYRPESSELEKSVMGLAQNSINMSIPWIRILLELISITNNPAAKGDPSCTHILMVYLSSFHTLTMTGQVWSGSEEVATNIKRIIDAIVKSDDLQLQAILLTLVEEYVEHQEKELRTANSKLTSLFLEYNRRLYGQNNQSLDVVVAKYNAQVESLKVSHVKEKEALIREIEILKHKQAVAEIAVNVDSAASTAVITPAEAVVSMLKSVDEHLMAELEKIQASLSQESLSEEVCSIELVRLINLTKNYSDTKKGKKIAITVPNKLKDLKDILDIKKYPNLKEKVIIALLSMANLYHIWGIHGELERDYLKHAIDKIRAVLSKVESIAGFKIKFILELMGYNSDLALNVLVNNIPSVEATHILFDTLMLQFSDRGWAGKLTVLASEIYKRMEAAPAMSAEEWHHYFSQIIAIINAPTIEEDRERLRTMLNLFLSCLHTLIKDKLIPTLGEVITIESLQRLISDVMADKWDLQVKITLLTLNNKLQEYIKSGLQQQLHIQWVWYQGCCEQLHQLRTGIKAGEAEIATYKGYVDRLQAEIKDREIELANYQKYLDELQDENAEMAEALEASHLECFILSKDARSDDLSKKVSDKIVAGKKRARSDDHPSVELPRPAPNVRASFHASSHLFYGEGGGASVLPSPCVIYSIKDPESEYSIPKPIKLPQAQTSQAGESATNLSADDFLLN